MLVKDLIANLQELQAKHEKFRYFEGEDYLGEAAIHIDVFKAKIDNSHMYTYQGASDKIKIEVSRDGVLNILSAFSDSYPREET